MKEVFFNGESVVPSKIVCVGRNYVEHIYELKNEIPTTMVLFMKPNSALGSALLTFPQTPLHYEGEICFLIRNGIIAGVGFGLDLTNRFLQSELKAKGLPWERAKAFDGAAVMSSFVSIESSDIAKLSMQLWMNNVLAQEAGVELMIYKPEQIIDEIATFSTLIDNDIVMSGTPKGVGSYVKGDTFVGKIFSDGKEIISQKWIAY
ncbi:MAG: FAA hydrolase family protein [Epsilonproteobacteria bacterium]|nr:FAA hydrolase family protein [Campylobacterota bacterium]